jgi:hypothetical protein
MTNRGEMYKEMLRDPETMAHWKYHAAQILRADYMPMPVERFSNNENGDAMITHTVDEMMQLVIGAMLFAADNAEHLLFGNSLSPQFPK